MWEYKWNSYGSYHISEVFMNICDIIHEKFADILEQILSESATRYILFCFFFF